MMKPVQSLVGLPLLRATMLGRQWERAFDVRKVAVMIGRRPRYGLVVDLYADVREQVVEEVRPDVAAMWADALERLGVR